MSEGASADRNPGRVPKWARGLLRCVPALLILGLVAWFLPWQDTLVVGDREIAGTFLSDWRGESVRFRPDATGALTASPTERLDGEGVLEVTRGEGLSGGNQLTWRPSLPVALAGVSPPRLARAFGFLLLGSLLTALRWWWLLTASGCPSRPGPVLRLSYLGVFFNLALPGLTAGPVLAMRAGLPLSWSISELRQPCSQTVPAKA